MSKKLSKQEKKEREVYRGAVAASVEKLRREPLSGSEKRYVLKKDFLPNVIRQDVVEALADHIQAHALGVPDLFVFMDDENASARAIWYCFATYNPADSKKKAPKAGQPAPFDPCGERRTGFTIDIRIVQNVHLVTEALYLYWRDSRADLFPKEAFDAFVAACTAAGDDDAQVTEALRALLKHANSAGVGSIQRLVMLINSLSDDAAKDRALRLLGPAALRVGDMSADQVANTSSMRERAFRLLCSAAADLLPPKYASTERRIGQARHFVPQPLAENEWAILLDGAEKIKFKGGDVVMAENSEQDALYRVADGSFSVSVGDTHVATLIQCDWFGEVAFLGNHYSRARVVAEKKGATAYKVPFGKLDAILLSRPDLAGKFYALLAIESSSRLNVALIQSSRLASQKEHAIDPRAEVVPHVLRSTIEQRPRDKKTESAFVYEANTHAVRAWSCKRLAEKANKEAHPGLVYIFPTQIVSVYTKGFGEKKSVVPFTSVTEFALEEQGSRIRISYTEKKKVHTFTLEFENAATAGAAHAVAVQIRNATPASDSVKDFGPVSAVSLFSCNTGRPNELPLTAGDRVTVLDEKASWYYGFVTDKPDDKGLFPKSFVELRPIGVGVVGALQESEWLSEFGEDVVHFSLKQGETVLKEGDPIHAGHLLFVESGRLQAQRHLANGMEETLGEVEAGETLGELIFLLGGVPRSNVTVASDTAEVVALPRSKLLERLKNDVLAAKFWKYLCCVVASRLMAVQARLNESPSVPEPIEFRVSDAEKAKAQSIGSLPSMPELPALPPASEDPKDALLRKIKQRGAFFLGVDVPAEVEERTISPRKHEGEEAAAEEKE